MSPDIKTELHIPDLWYDFFARLLPGITFISALRLLVFSNKTFPDFAEMIALVFAGYISALITQPLSSWITGLIQSKFGRLPSGEQDRVIFIRKIQQNLGESSRQTLVLSKMHAESTFFVQLAVLSPFVFIIQLLMATAAVWPTLAFHLLWIILMISNASAVASRRIKRGQQLNEAMKKSR